MSGGLTISCLLEFRTCVVASSQVGQVRRTTNRRSYSYVAGVDTDREARLDLATVT